MSSPTYVAAIYGALGEIDEAFKWLEEAYEERDGDLRYLKVDPYFDTVRPDPRFTGLLKRIGLAE